MQDRSPTTDPMADHYVGAARKLLEDLADSGTATDREVFRLLGRTEVIVSELLRMVAPDQD